jgi:Class II flagellar assembly regulator
MRIDWSPKLQAATQRRDSRGAEGGSNFADAIANEKQTAPASTTAAAPAAIDGLFVLQEVAEDLNGRRRAAARGERLLDRLEDLRLALLSGKMPRAQLDQLRSLAKEHGPTVDDPQLAAVLAEIELRVAVELAKLDTLG